MMLSGKEIEKKLGSDIIIEPFNRKQLNPNSYNLRLHNELLVYDEDILDMKKENKTKSITIPEYTETKNYVPMLEGRSSIGRLGLFIHVTAGFGDVGFKGYWTLEIFCVQPIRIYPSVEVCQIYYHGIDGDYEEYSSGKYQSNKGIQPSLLYKDFK